ncbi:MULTISPECIES: hypothetical protein [unclassified Pseudomonas]|uniref:hypothetical protein n=1 Tax=unclassified Pseudomonas TaxID=196821 RepID=UPI000A1DFE4F|nr:MULTISPECIES: hypothetical protein [unclassified Pseudomonas]
MGAADDLKKRLALENSIDCIKISITEQYRAGSDITVVKLSPDDVENLDAIKGALEVEGRKFELNEAENELKIDSTNCTSES